MSKFLDFLIQNKLALVAMIISIIAANVFLLLNIRRKDSEEEIEIASVFPAVKEHYKILWHRIALTVSIIALLIALTLYIAS